MIRELIFREVNELTFVSCIVGIKPYVRPFICFISLHSQRCLLILNCLPIFHTRKGEKFLSQVVFTKLIPKLMFFLYILLSNVSIIIEEIRTEIRETLSKRSFYELSFYSFYLNFFFSFYLNFLYVFDSINNFKHLPFAHSSKSLASLIYQAIDFSSFAYSSRACQILYLTPSELEVILTTL